MFRNIKLRKASLESDRDFYLQSFLDPKWAALFDLNLENPNSDREQYIQQKISGQYPDLTRLIAYNHQSKEKEEKIAFGQILIDDAATKRCSLTGGVAPQFMGKGYGSVILYLALKIIFLDWGMNKVTCNVYDFNSASFKMLETAGFKLEGILRQHGFSYPLEKFIDMRIYSMLSQEFSESNLVKSLSKLGLSGGIE